ncbi:MAG: flagellar brake protein [Gammaproteobacteria bacterium]|nr:flagellar brake protein [Gammaproteobacteria bacterium]
MSPVPSELRIGEMLYLQIEQDGLHHLSPSTLLGYVDSRHIRVSLPRSEFPLVEGCQVVVKRRMGGQIVRFNSRAAAIRETPYPSLHLVWPVMGQKQAPLAESVVVASEGILLNVSTQSGKSSMVRMKNITVGEACLSGRDRLGNVGDRLLISIRSPFGPGLVKLKSVIRFVHEETGTHPGVTHGVRFTELDEEGLFFLECFIGRGWYQGSCVV